MSPLPSSPSFLSIPCPSSLPAQPGQQPTWPARACEVESLLHDARQVLDVHDQVVVLSDGARDLHDGRLLEGISADEAAGHLHVHTAYMAF
eukprot:1158344-Pelagomonas_calceolata.AAC.11